MPGLQEIMLSEIITVFITLFAVIDILGSIPVLIGLKKKMGEINSLQATLVSGALMLVFFFAGGENRHGLIWQIDFKFSLWIRFDCSKYFF